MFLLDGTVGTLPSYWSYYCSCGGTRPEQFELPVGYDIDSGDKISAYDYLMIILIINNFVYLDLGLQVAYLGGRDFLTCIALI